VDVVKLLIHTLIMTQHETLPPAASELEAQRAYEQAIRELGEHDARLAHVGRVLAVLGVTES